MPRPVLLAILSFSLTLPLVLIGCGGPTTQGIKARSEAGERLNMVNAQVSYDQAKRSFETGDLDRALREINGAISRYDDVADFHALKGRILLEQHRLERAMRAFDQAVSHDADHAGAHYFAGVINQRWSRHDEAYERYRTASELDPENVQYLLAAAESLIALGRYDESETLVTDALSYHEHNAALRHLLGHIAMLQGDPTRHAALLEKARLLNPDDRSLLEELALARFNAGRYSSCLDAVGELYRTYPSAADRVDLRHLEARALSRLERYVESRRIYIDLARLSPGEADVWIELAAVALELGDERRLDQGSAEAMRIAPERHEGYLLRAMYERDRGNLNQAERLFNLAIERAAPGGGSTHTRASHLSLLLLGQLLEEQGRVDQARDAYASALRLQPESREARALLSRIDNGEAFSSVIE